MARRDNLENDLMEQIKMLCPGAHCAYFPMEGKYQVHINGKDIGTWQDTRLVALKSALAALQTRGH